MEKEISLSESITEQLFALRNYKDKQSIFNDFGVFVEIFINFRQRHYKENNSPQNILFDKNLWKQGVISKQNQAKEQINLPGSRLSDYLAQTFALFTP